MQKLTDLGSELNGGIVSPLPLSNLICVNVQRLQAPLALQCHVLVVICTPVLWHYSTLLGCCCRDRSYSFLHMLVLMTRDAYWSGNVIIAMGRERDLGKSNISEAENRCFSSTMQFAESCWTAARCAMNFLLFWTELSRSVFWGIFLIDVYLCYKSCIRNLNISVFLSFFRFQDELGWFHQYEPQSGMGFSVPPFRLCASIWQADWLQLFLGRTVKWTKKFSLLLLWVGVFCFAALTSYLWFTFCTWNKYLGK